MPLICNVIEPKKTGKSGVNTWIYRPFYSISEEDKYRRTGKKGLSTGPIFHRLDIVDQLHENSQKINSIERLTRHLNKGIPTTALKSYLTAIRKWETPSEPVIHIDDSSVVKPDGSKFEALLFLKLDGFKQNYVIRLTAKRKLYLI